MEFYNELLPLISYVYSSKPESSFTTRQLLKILFKLKKQLPDNELLQKALPYYWYTHGPYSETVANSITSMIRSDTLNLVEADGYELPCLPKAPIIIKTVAEPEVYDALKSILATHDVYHPDKLISEIYRNYAPYEFVSLYKLELLTNLRQYVSRRKFDEILSLEDVLYECEAALPIEPFFEDFNNEFSLFVTYTSLLFDHARETKGINTSFYQTLKTAETLWARFASGLRILPKGHDEFYEDRLPRWLAMFRKDVKYKLVPKIDFYNSYVTKQTTTAQSSLGPLAVL